MQTNQDLLYRQIGKQVKEWRIDAEFSQSQLAEAIGVLRTSITNLEGGRQKSPLHMLYEICFVLDKSIHDLFPKKEHVINNRKMSIEIGGRIHEVPEQSAAVLKNILEE